MTFGSNRAFTLLEVMVCAAVLVIAITVFLMAIAQNVQLEAMNAETNIALNAANSVIETVRGLTYAEVTAANIPPTFEASGLGNDGRTIRLINAAGSTQVGQAAISENPAGTSRTVQVRVTWRCATGEMRRTTLMTEVTSY
ncbi:MAG TPA: type II secretion system protein [Planctomycetota bacterium]|nr:type II secretion system protein [Planctomycetota bacterium]